MQLLFLSNFYPPLSRGGYEAWCQEVAEGLRAHGHGVTVLTSRHGSGTHPFDPDWVLRRLHLEMEIHSLRNGVQFFTHRRQREAENVAWLQRLVAEQSPDAIVIWGMWNMPRSLPAAAERLMGRRVAYYLGDYWPTLPSQFRYFWDAPPRNRVTAVPKALLRLPARWLMDRDRQPALTFPHALFCSQFLGDELQRQDITFRRTKVIQGAVDTAPFARQSERQKAPDQPLRLLYAGRLREDKGVQTAVAAVAALANQHHLDTIHLTIAGTGEPEVVASLRQLVHQNGIESQVTFLGARPAEEMPRLYREADIFLFTSIWPEPFGRVIVEAMAAGTAVVGACSGGAAEILQDGQNALTFPPGDAAALAGQIAALAASPDLRRRLVTNGRRTARQFEINRMIAEIEAYLETAVL